MWWIFAFTVMFGPRPRKVLYNSLVSLNHMQPCIESSNCKCLGGFFCYRSLHHPGNAAPTERGGARSWHHGSHQDTGLGPEPSERGSDQRASGAVHSAHARPSAPAGEKERWDGVPDPLFVLSHHLYSHILLFFFFKSFCLPHILWDFF